MTETEIITEIKRYLSDRSYYYAVMIDGDWGCGKTYFVKNGLTNAIVAQESKSEKPRKVVYISLYGYKTILDIQDAIAIQLHLLTENGNNSFLGKLRKKRVVENGIQSAFALAKAARDILAPGTSVFDFEGIWRDLASYIFIFDDVERCDCSINEAFGFINGLVEHSGAKVILVANEKEIRISNVTEQRELQYLVATNDRIVFPIIKSVWRDENKAAPLTPEELERRRKIVFPITAVDEEFKKIREKLIGVTLRFQPNLKEICKEIINNSSFNNDIKCVLLGDLDDFYYAMFSAEHLNLRTFQFFLSKLNNLFDSFAEIEVTNEYTQTIKSKIISDCFSSAVDFKANKQPPEDEIARISFDIDHEKRFKEIKHYIETGELRVEKLQEEIDRFIDENVIDLILPDDPYKMLQAGYYLHPQDWCEERIAEILDKLKKNEYPTIVYGEVLQPLLILESMGFDKKYLDTAKAYMITNIAKADNPQSPNEYRVVFEKNSDAQLRAVEALTEIKNAVAERNNTEKTLSIKEIVKQETWVDGLAMFAERNNLKDNPNILVFSTVGSDAWISLLCQSSPETIYKFRQWFHMYYPTNITWQNKPADVDVLELIAKGITPDKANDLIVKNLLVWSKNDIQRYCAPYRNREHESESE